ncbi:MAG: metallophosphoesterase family protein [Bacteroidetes bacterium]|nr:metallophosphoesterase family protein [Bacteroidota bacterium]
MKIGLLSDTHGHLDSAIFDYFKDCDEIWHAGDIGSLKLLHQLQEFKPIRAVFGNIDSLELQQDLSEDLWFDCEGAMVLITHIAGKPPRFNKRVLSIIKESNPPNILVCGHSHILRVMYDKTNQLLYLNPGACGRQGFHKIRTLLRFEISDSAARNMEVIELGNR